MVADHRAQVDELLADYRRSREQLAAVQRELSAISETSANADGTVTATVGARGTLIALELADQAYRRYRPAELAQEIVKVTAAATIKAFAGAGEVLAPVLPAGTDPQALLLGTADLADEEITPADKPNREPEESFEDQSWVHPKTSKGAR